MEIATLIVNIFSAVGTVGATIASLYFATAPHFFSVKPIVHIKSSKTAHNLPQVIQLIIKNSNSSNVAIRTIRIRVYDPDKSSQDFYLIAEDLPKYSIISQACTEQNINIPARGCKEFKINLRSLVDNSDGFNLLGKILENEHKTFKIQAILIDQLGKTRKTRRVKIGRYAPKDDELIS